MIASRLSGRRGAERRPAQAEAADPGELAPSSQEIKEARAELSEELARRSARADNSPP
jgi:hypothetical protein